ncbi:MAG: hypothetical protein GYA24_03580 [Candidatus Lokiarchaeota archaeon]|nr:hypothetical protein [Candidatus Lokiarchaeota archaeon]
MVKERITPTRFQVELENLLAGSGISALLGGFLLVAIWAAFEFIDDAAQYMHYAAPLITKDLLTVALILGTINLGHFLIDMVAIGLVHAKNDRARAFCLVSALLQLWLPPVGTFFGIMLLSLYRNWPGLAEGKDAASIDDKSMVQHLHLVSLYLVLGWCFLLLFINAIYILPMEFLNDAELIWLRFNIWNIFYAGVAFLGLLTAFFVIANYLAAKKARGWKVLLSIECFLLLFAIPVGTYLAGVFYRNFVKKQE